MSEITLNLDARETDESLSLMLIFRLGSTEVGRKTFFFGKTGDYLTLGGPLKQYRTDAMRSFVENCRARKPASFALTGTDTFECNPQSGTVKMSTRADGIETELSFWCTDANVSKLAQFVTLIDEHTTSTAPEK